MGYYNIDNAWYGEGSLRAGRTKTNFSSADFLIGVPIEYETRATYAGAHVGGGYLLAGRGIALDMSGKLLFTYQGQGGELDIGDWVKLHTAYSIRARSGGKILINAAPNAAPYAGAYLDYEFAGKADATINGDLGGGAVEAPALTGATGVGEIGVGIKPSLKLPLTLDAGVQGYAGVRQGFGANMTMKYVF